MKDEKLRYSVSGSGVFSKLCILFLALSVLLRLLGCWGFWADPDGRYVMTQVALPILACLLFILTVQYLGKKLFFLSFIPVLMGAVFFVFRALGIDGVLKTVLCIALCVFAAFFYTLTVFGVVKTKWLLPPLFGLPLLYRAIVVDGASFLAREGAIELSEFIPELSALCILLAMTLIPFAMKKRDFSEKEPEELETIELLVENEEPLPELPAETTTGGDTDE